MAHAAADHARVARTSEGRAWECPQRTIEPRESHPHDPIVSITAKRQGAAASAQGRIGQTGPDPIRRRSSPTRRKKRA